MKTQRLGTIFIVVFFLLAQMVPVSFAADGQTYPIRGMGQPSLLPEQPIGAVAETQPSPNPSASPTGMVETLIEESALIVASGEKESAATPPGSVTYGNGEKGNEEIIEPVPISAESLEKTEPPMLLMDAGVNIEAGSSEDLDVVLSVFDDYKEYVNFLGPRTMQSIDSEGTWWKYDQSFNRSAYYFRMPRTDVRGKEMHVIFEEILDSPTKVWIELKHKGGAPAYLKSIEIIEGEPDQEFAVILPDKEELGSLFEVVILFYPEFVEDTSADFRIRSVTFRDVAFPPIDTGLSIGVLDPSDSRLDVDSEDYDPNYERWFWNIYNSIAAGEEWVDTARGPMPREQWEGWRRRYPSRPRVSPSPSPTPESPDPRSLKPIDDLDAGTFNFADQTLIFMSRNKFAGNSLDIVSNTEAQLHYDVEGEDYYSGISYYFGKEGIDLSSMSHFVIGAESPTTNAIRLHIEDPERNRAVFFLTDVTETRSYYEVPITRIPEEVDLSRILTIEAFVDSDLVPAGGEKGAMTTELGEFYERSEVAEEEGVSGS